MNNFWVNWRKTVGLLWTWPFLCSDGLQEQSAVLLNLFVFSVSRQVHLLGGGFWCGATSLSLEFDCTSLYYLWICEFFRVLNRRSFWLIDLSIFSRCLSMCLRLISLLLVSFRLVWYCMWSTPFYWLTTISIFLIISILWSFCSYLDMQPLQR